MANTTKLNGHFITITGLDADWSLSTDLPQFSGTGLKVYSIRFNPSGANDVMIVHENGIDNAEVFRVKAAAGTDDRIQYYDPSEWMFPVIDISDCVLATAANAAVTIHIKQP